MESLCDVENVSVIVCRDECVCVPVCVCVCMKAVFSSTNHRKPGCQTGTWRRGTKEGIRKCRGGRTKADNEESQKLN